MVKKKLELQNSLYPSSELWTLVSFSRHLDWDAFVQQEQHSQEVQLQGTINVYKQPN